MLSRDLSGSGPVFIEYRPESFVKVSSGSISKEFTCSAGNASSIPGSGRAPEEGNGNPLQYSCLGNPMDRGAWASYSQWDPKELDMT